jgi:eukaryotic-like serine/threonine-protein kinase
LTAETLSPATTTTGPIVPAKKKPVALERPRFPLALKLFALMGLLIAIVVGIAIGVTIQRANRIAHTTVNKSISSAAKLYHDFEHQRIGRLELAAQILGTDPTFAAYVQTSLNPAPEPAAATVPGAPAAPVAAPAPDYVSLLDQLNQRKESLRTDLMILFDPQGRLAVRTDQPATVGMHTDELSKQLPLVRDMLEDASLPSTSGVVLVGDRLYHAAVHPIAVGANAVPVGYLLIAYTIDEAFANRIADSTNAGVMFAAAKAAITRSSNAPSVGMQQMRGSDEIFRSGKPVPPSNVRIESSDYVMTGEPLTAGPHTVGAAIFIRSLDRELAPFKEIENTLLLGGGAALLLAFLFSFLIAKRVTRPIAELAGVAQAVTAGDYTVHPAIDSSDEVGILGRAFAKMITALRDKSELEELYEQMAAKSEEREAVNVHHIVEPKLEEGTVLVTDLRGVSVQGDAVAVIGEVSRAMKIQEAEVSRQDGEVREIVGHRLVSIFRGDRGVIHAIRAARAINEELTLQLGTGSPVSIGVGVATGEFISGSVVLEQESGLAVVGDAPLLAQVFAWHAPSGYAYISYETAQTAGGEILSSSQREEVRLKWLQHPMPVASLPLASMTTGMMRSIGASVADATMRIDSTQAGTTAPATAAPVELQAGQLFAGRYRIEQIVGRGGMGIVYKAVDTQLDEPVAIKTLPGDVMTRSPEDLERFKREIRLARKITHRNVLRTYDYGEAEGVYFISMELVRGYTLAELLAEAEAKQMAPRVAVGIMRQVSRGLEVAHEQGIIHRDIKPQNVLIDHKGEVKLMDFGIARMAEAHEGMTQAGLIVGTPHYMSPEQVQGKQLDSRSDVYSMGVMLYELVAGRRPFESSSLTGVLTAHITEKARPPIDLRPEIGRDINAIVMRCLEKDPKARYANAGELLHDLDAVSLQQAAA